MTTPINAGQKQEKCQHCGASLLSAAPSKGDEALARLEEKIAGIKRRLQEPATPANSGELAAINRANECREALTAANIAAIKGYTEETLQKYVECTNLWPDKPETWYRKGMCLQIMGKHDEAIAAYSRCLKIDPRRFAVINRDIGLCLTQQGRLDDAIVAYDKAMDFAIDLETPKILLSKARALYQQKKHDEAKRTYDKAIRLYASLVNLLCEEHWTARTENANVFEKPNLLLGLFNFDDPNKNDLQEKLRLREVWIANLERNAENLLEQNKAIDIVSGELKAKLSAYEKTGLTIEQIPALQAELAELKGKVSQLIFYKYEPQIVKAGIITRGLPSDVQHGLETATRDFYHKYGLSADSGETIAAAVALVSKAMAIYSDKPDVSRDEVAQLIDVPARLIENHNASKELGDALDVLTPNSMGRRFYGILRNQQRPEPAQQKQVIAATAQADSYGATKPAAQATEPKIENPETRKPTMKVRCKCGTMTPIYETSRPIQFTCGNCSRKGVIK